MQAAFTIFDVDKIIRLNPCDDTLVSRLQSNSVKGWPHPPYCPLIWNESDSIANLEWIHLADSDTEPALLSGSESSSYFNCWR